MKKELMEDLGLPEGVASRALGVLSSDQLRRLLAAAGDDPEDRDRIGAAVVDLVTGRTTIDAVLFGTVSSQGPSGPQGKGPGPTGMTSASFEASEPAAWREPEQPAPQPQPEPQEGKRKKR